MYRCESLTQNARIPYKITWKRNTSFRKAYFPLGNWNASKTHVCCYEQRVECRLPAKVYKYINKYLLLRANTYQLSRLRCSTEVYPPGDFLDSIDWQISSNAVRIYCFRLCLQNKTVCPACFSQRMPFETALKFKCTCAFAIRIWYTFS